MNSCLASGKAGSLLLAGWLLWATSAFMAFVSCIACFSASAKKAGRRAALTAIVISGGIVAWVIAENQLQAFTTESGEDEFLLTLGIAAAPCLVGIVCLLILDRQNQPEP